MPDQPHECDLFLLSSHRPYYGDRILPAFARHGRRNIDGWGIGSFVNGQAQVLRRAEPAVEGENLSGEFAVAVEAVSSPVILGHLRLTSRGRNRKENNHPFLLNFLGYDWLLIHNGSARNHEQLVPTTKRLLPESDNDTPRVYKRWHSKQQKQSERYFLRCRLPTRLNCLKEKGHWSPNPVPIPK